MLDPQLDQLIATVREVAQTEVMPRFLRVGHSRKEDGTLFTAADLACQQALQRLLPKIADAPVLGEEMSKEEQEAHWDAGTEALWVCDPIDGTTNFVHGLPYFAISVALLRQRRPVLAVTYNPVADEMYYAQAGCGAWLNGVRLPLKQHTPAIQDAIAGVETKWLGGRLPGRLASLAPYGSQRNFGASTLDWCYLAAGRFDLYIHGGQRLWDYAAGCLILSEAGGRIAGIWHDDYWEEPIWTRSAVAALHPPLFEQWHAWIKNNR